MFHFSNGGQWLLQFKHGWGRDFSHWWKTRMRWKNNMQSFYWGIIKNKFGSVAVRSEVDETKTHPQAHNESLLCNTWMAWPFVNSFVIKKVMDVIWLRDTRSIVQGANQKYSFVFHFYLKVLVWVSLICLALLWLVPPLSHEIRCVPPIHPPASRFINACLQKVHNSVCLAKQTNWLLEIYDWFPECP